MAFSGSIYGRNEGNCQIGLELVAGNEKAAFKGV